MTRWLIDITGQRFGRWYVHSCAGFLHGKVKWKCLCDCGTEKLVDSYSLRNGGTSSCGCLIKERATKHGDYKERLYKTWQAMRERCNNKNNAAYRYYGGKGVSVCGEWNDYLAFKQWALANGYSSDLTIERKDSSGNYEPSNCEWITQSENSRRMAVKQKRHPQ